ncbi:MAG: YihY/virulence factor BrkB family protein [bacterium]|nr:YihY/virulence factor BrkB family protein [bacterium]
MSDRNRIRALGRWWRGLKYYAVGLYHRVEDHHIFLLAGGLAFSLYVTIIPLVLIIFAALGAIVERPSIVAQIDKFIDTAIPYQDYAAEIRELVYVRLANFAAYRGHAGVIGIVGLLVASTSLFSSMRTVLNRVYRVIVRQHMLIGKLRDLGLVLAVLLFFLLAIAVLPGLEVAKEAAERIAVFQEYDLGLLSGLLFQVTSFVLTLFGFAFLYLALPQMKPSGRVVMVSAGTAAVLWHLAKVLFGFYIVHFFSIKEVYGAYAILVVVAFWVYYTSMVFIIGGEVGQLYRERVTVDKT